MDPIATALLTDIHSAFADVRLGRGISWREAGVIDDYGSTAMRSAARAADEQRDWTKVPDELLGALRYQSSVTFLDEEGLHFYLPALMRYVLQEYASTDSVTPESLVSRLTDRERGARLRQRLTAAQTECVRRFLEVLAPTPEFEFDRGRIGASLGGIWASAK